MTRDYLFQAWMASVIADSSNFLWYKVTQNCKTPKLLVRTILLILFWTTCVWIIRLTIDFVAFGLPQLECLYYDFIGLPYHSSSQKKYGHHVGWSVALYSAWTLKLVLDKESGKGHGPMERKCGFNCAQRILAILSKCKLPRATFTLQVEGQCKIQ